MSQGFPAGRLQIAGAAPRQVAALQRFGATDLDPTIAHLVEIGKSLEGRPILALNVTSKPNGGLPAVRINSGQHARELPTVELTSRLMHTLTEGYGKDGHITDLVNGRDIWIVPIVNPDGRVRVQGGESMWRKNARKLSFGANGVDTNGAIFGRLPLEGLSKYSYNLAGYYEKGIVSVRLAYNWRSRYLLSTNVNGTQGSDGSPITPDGVQCDTAANAHCVVWGLPVYNASYGQLDGSIFFKFLNDKISMGVEAQNLTNSVNRVLMQQSFGMMGRAWFQSDRRYTASVRVKF